MNINNFLRCNFLVHEADERREGGWISLFSKRKDQQSETARTAFALNRERKIDCSLKKKKKVGSDYILQHNTECVA